MNKQLLPFLLTLLMSMVGTHSFAHDIEVQNSNGVTIYYVWTNNNTELAVSYRGSSDDSYTNEYSGNIVIPSTVEYNGNTYSVTSIDIFAFSQCSGLTSVTIPNSVTSIGEYAFQNCSGLNSIIIPNSVTSLEGNAFWNCSSLESITVETGNNNYDSRNNCNAIIEKETKTLIRGCKNTIIPDDLTNIGYGAFAGCTGLTSIDIPNSVTSIGGGAFSGCSSIESVIIPNGVQSINNSAFEDCTSLKSISIPSSVTNIGLHAFCDCKALTSVNISDISSWVNIVFEAVFPDSNPLYYAHHLYLNGKEIKDLVIPDGVKHWR